MPEEKEFDRIFISIAVSKPGGGLAELPGAISAAERMAAWARGQNYLVVLIHDEPYREITVDLLRHSFAEAIKQVTALRELKRLVIFFAGHGAALASNDQFWILTNWEDSWSEAIRVSSLQRMLEYYGPQQVSIIGDACQEFSSRFSILNGSSVLDKPHPAEEQRQYELDQFFAVDVGMQAFMIKANGDTKDFCLFTEVVLDVLEVDTTDVCYEVIGDTQVVTSQSLANYLVKHVPREAGKYGVRMTTNPRPGFYTDRAYLTRPRPHAQELRALTRTNRVNLPKEAYEQPETIVVHSRSVRKASLVKSKLRKIELAVQNLKLKKAEGARQAIRKAFIDKVTGANVRDHFETRCGVCVSGAEVANVEASFGEVSRVHIQPNWFRIELEDGIFDSLGWSDTLITLKDGRIVAACVVNSFVAALHILDVTSLTLFHRPLSANEYNDQQAIDLLAQAHAGLLNRKAIINAATMLRYGKHQFITLGCIAAQFYDVIRDVDSLRSMAAFYVMNQQPIPLDIILFGGGTIIEDGGRLYADIPAVADREPRTPEEQDQRFTYRATPEFKKYPIAGRIPWMRQAWSAVSTVSCHESAENWRSQALEAIDYLAPGTFTTAKPAGRAAFLKLAGITVNKGELEPFLTMQ